MLPPIGSVSMLAAQGRAGVVVDARPLGEPEDGQQLVALKIKAGAAGGGDLRGSARLDGTQSNARSAGKAGTPEEPPHLSPAPAGPAAGARRLDQLSAVERADVAKLQQRDQQVRQEEQAHAAVAGDLAGPINYIYRRGPDGRQYAVGGSVGIQASTTGADPAEAKRLSARMAAAANAATNPSAQDYAAARQAYAFGSQLAEPTADPMARARAAEAKEGPNLDMIL